MRTLDAECGYQLRDCFAYSDSVTDLPLLELAGQPELTFRQTGGEGM